METQKLRKFVEHDDWLYTRMTQMIKMINTMQNQIQNQDLKKYKAKGTDCEEILKQLKLVMQERKKNLFSNIFSLFFKKSVLQILGMQALINSLMLFNLLILNQVTKCLQIYDGNNKLYLISLLCGMICISLMKTYLYSKTDYLVYSTILRLRLIAEYLIYDKALNVQCRSKEQSDTHTANIYTLLTTDLEKIMLINYAIKDLWEAVILITGCLVYLYHLDWHAGTIVVITMVLAQFFNFVVVIGMNISEKKMLEYKDLRVGITTDIIEGIKQIKYLSWEEIFSQKIMSFRKKEFFMLAALKIFDGLCQIFWNNISYVLLCAYIISVKNEQTLQDLNIFALIAIFNTMVYPLGSLPWSMNCGILSYVSFKRIKIFLQTQEINFNDRLQSPYPKEGDVIKFEDSKFEWPTEKNSQKKVDQQTPQVKDESVIADDENSSFLLKINNFSVEKNTLNFIVGKIGSGKTSLFNMILNELQRLDDDFRDKDIKNESDCIWPESSAKTNQQILKGKLGYCSQSSWVQNMSIRENILFGNSFNQQLYNEVIDACEIRKDIMTFEKQDLHEVGPDGKNLSGGQKQRIALARALYQQCDIYLLDDIFSSLDVHIADKIFQKAIIEQLINQGKTVLLITSHYRYLNKSPNFKKTRIIFIQNGLIQNDLDMINGYLQKQKQQDVEEYNYNDSIKIKEDVENFEQEQLAQNEDQDIEVNQEQREKGKISDKTWSTYFASMNWFLLIGWLIFNFGMQGSMSLIDFWLKSELNDANSWLHQITIYFQDSITDTLLHLTILALLITFMRATLYVLFSLRSAWVIFQRLNNVLMTSIMKFYDKTNAGRIINIIQDDTTMIDHELSLIFHCLLQNLNRVVGLIIGLMLLQPALVILIFLIAIFYSQVFRSFLKSNREIQRLKSVNSGSLLQTVNETLTGIKTIRAFDKTDQFKRTFENKLSDWAMTDSCGERSKIWFTVRQNLMYNLILICVSSVVIFTLFVDVQEDYTVQALAITYSIVVMENLYELFSLYLRMESGIVSVERVMQYLRNETENIDQVPKQQIISHQLWRDNQQFTKINDLGTVVFRNIFLTYDDEVSSEVKYALKNFSLSISKGEKVAFVGKTGSGKTSIFNILFGLYKFQHGQILINGKDVATLTLRELRSQLSVVPQFGFLYNESVKNNLDPEGKATKQDIEKLFSDTGFQLRGINNVINNFCNADFIVSQNGANLSNGEKQVLNFLRIVLLNKNIICLDEATSNMDPKTDQLLHELLFKFAENRTLLVITHRLENIKIYDKIIVMEQGEIVEQGNYSDLIKIEGGFFNKLLSKQQKCQNF